MTALVSQGLKGVFDALADAIEGGNTYRGSGTAFKGIPGQYSSDLKLAAESPLTVYYGISTSSFQVAKTWSPNRWVVANGPAWWVLDAAGEHRKITSSVSGPGATTVTSCNITVSTVVVGQTYTVTLDGVAASYVAVLGDVASTILEGLLTSVMALGFVGQHEGLPLIVRKADSSPFFVSVTSNLTLEKVGEGAASTVTVFGVGTAFTTSPRPADTLSVLQGFKRLPNGVDIEDGDAGSPDGYDRCFHLHALAGTRAPWSGSGAWTFMTDLKLRVRFLKFGRLQDWTAAAMTDMAVLRAGLARTEHYDGTYMRALIPDGATTIVREDATKLVVEDSFKLFYRLDTSFS